MSATTTDAQPGLVMVHMAAATTVTLSERKDDDTGWWLVEHGGLCDEVIADGSWRPLASVLAEYRAALDFVVWCSQEDYRGPMPEHVRRARDLLHPAEQGQ